MQKIILKPIVGSVDTKPNAEVKPRIWNLSGNNTVDIDGNKVPYISKTKSLNITAKSGLIFAGLAYFASRALANNTRAGGIIAGILAVPTALTGLLFLGTLTERK